MMDGFIRTAAGERRGAARFAKGGPIVLHDLFRRLDARFPGLARWLGGRLDIQVPAIAVSLVTHLLLLMSLGMVGYAAHTELRRELQTEVVDTSLEDFARLDAVELTDVSEPTTITPAAGAFAPTATPLIIEQPSGAVPPKPEPGLARPRVELAADVVLPKATRLDQAVAINGSGADHVGDVKEAVDRLSVEILRRLTEGRTLVIWAFDASKSLQAERRRLAGYIDEVYRHLGALDRDGLARGGALLTLVVAFGEDRRLMTPEPTADAAAIARAIAAVPDDESGVESTFRTVAEVARTWGRYRRDDQKYRAMIIVVTDEVGDDEDQLEPAIAAAGAAHAPVYVLGSGALFGRIMGKQDYTDPKTGITYRDLDVRQGPESVEPETIRLPYWHGAGRFDALDAGFGPWALSRLAGATGGIYFVTRMGGHRVLFDPAGMREYRPDWVSKAQYEAALQRDPIRRALVQAGQITREYLPDNLPARPDLTFPAADSPEFKEAMNRNQKDLARIQYAVNAALEAIEAAAGFRDREPSRRWQAHYDLVRGRLLAMKIRCYEYQYACAQMKKNPLKFTDPASNAWRLAPDAEVHSGEAVAKAAEKARDLLEGVMSDHPQTPWALLARQELAAPLGLKWVEAHVPPPKPRPPSPEEKKKKEKPAPKPPPPPKL